MPRNALSPPRACCCKPCFCAPAAVLAATAITGVMQALLGGQPLLIVGVAEPIVLTYKFMFDFAQKQDGIGTQLFLPWCAWACVWASLLILLLAALNACAYINHFTRLAGELFGALIAVRRVLLGSPALLMYSAGVISARSLPQMLFLQQAIKGSIDEFHYNAVAAEAGVEALAGTGICVTAAQ